MARVPYSLLAALVLVDFADEWFSFLPAGALEPIRSELGLSYAEAGLLLTALSAGGLLGNGLVVAADFASRRLLASAGALVYGLCLIAFASADTFAVVLVAAFVWGTASDAFVHGSEVALVDLARDDLAPVLARVNAWGAVGDLLGPITVAAAAAAGVGWRPVFALGGALMLVYAAVLAVQPLPPPRPPAHARTPLAGLLAVLRDRRIVLLALIDALFGLLDEPFLGFTIAYLEQGRGLAAPLATAIGGVAVAGGIVGYFAVEAVSRRGPRGRLLVASATAVAVAVAGIVTLPFAPLVAAVAFAFGAAGAVFYSLLQATYLGLRPGQAGTSQAVVSLIGLAGAGFPLLVGAVADARGLAAGLALYALVPVAMLGLVLRLGDATPDEARSAA